MAATTPDRPDLASAGVGDLNATFCATLVDEWVRAGVTDAVVCPGSRSTPMALALAADDRLRVHVHHDERSGSFLALGLGRRHRAPGGRAHHQRHRGGRAPRRRGRGRPRSGAAPGRHRRPPARAARRRGPADHRPDPPLRPVHPVVRRSGRRPRADAAGSWRSLAARAVIEAAGSPAGPVHLNLPFREPLVGSALPLPDGRPAGRPWHEALGVDRRADPCDPPGRGGRGVLVAGGGIDEPEAVLALAEALGWPVLADPRSGCRVGPPERGGPRRRAAAGRPRAVAAPEVVVRLGGPPASKVLNQWLAGARRACPRCASTATAPGSTPIATPDRRRRRARRRCAGPSPPSSSRWAGSRAGSSVAGGRRRGRGAPSTRPSPPTSATEPGIARAVATRCRPVARSWCRRRCPCATSSGSRALTAGRHRPRQPGRQRHRRCGVDGRRRRRSAGVARRRC